MSEKKPEPHYDRMGKFIGDARSYEGISLRQLSAGLCTVAYLNQIENGQREAGKLLTDALLQRLGKPVELYERILDRKEFRQWQHRRKIVSHLKHGEIQEAQTIISTYKEETDSVLDDQFVQIAEINCRFLEGAAAADLLPLICQALKCTMPDFGSKPIDTLLFHQTEGHLLLARLELREQMEGLDTVIEEYQALLRCLYAPRYDSRSRAYIMPFIVCHILEWLYGQGRFSHALNLCEQALHELTLEHKLFAYDTLLEWKIKLSDSLGLADDTTKKLLIHLRSILANTPKHKTLLVPYEERGHVFCLNQLLRERRKILGLSQEEMAEGICDPRTISRIENQNISLQKGLRQQLLHRVNMSGERYDYQIITESYEDYVLCSEYGRAWNNNNLEKANKLFPELEKRAPDTKTNRQYLLTEDILLHGRLPETDARHLTRQRQLVLLHEALAITLPIDLNELDRLPGCTLSVNELFILIDCAAKYKLIGMREKTLTYIAFLRRCLESDDTDMAYYEDFYTRVMLIYASTLGDLGHYKESDAVDLLCLRLSLENRNSLRLAGYLYDMAWNFAQQFPQSAEEIRPLTQQAYAAALIADDPIRQSRIMDFAYELYGKELTL